MICARCGKPMHTGEFKMEVRSADSGIYHTYPVAAWYMDGEKYCETNQDSTVGYYCPDCGLMAGVFLSTRPVGFLGRFNKDLDDNIDKLPVKVCPFCEKEIDIDYPRCPHCGFVFEII